MSYAQALFELSKEHKCEKEVYEAALVLQSCLISEPKYLLLVSSPVIDLQERIKLLQKVLQNVPVLLKNTALLLCEKNEIAIFNEVLDDYISYYTQQNKILEVLVTSAIPLSNQIETRLKSALKKRFNQEILMKTNIDESCIGGLKLQMNGQQYDGSIDRQLNEMKKVLLDNAHILYEINSANEGDRIDT